MVFEGFNTRDDERCAPRWQRIKTWCGWRAYKSYRFLCQTVTVGPACAYWCVFFLIVQVECGEERVETDHVPKHASAKVFPSSGVFSWPPVRARGRVRDDRAILSLPRLMALGYQGAKCIRSIYSPFFYVRRNEKNYIYDNVGFVFSSSMKTPDIKTSIWNREPNPGKLGITWKHGSWLVRAVSKTVHIRVHRFCYLRGGWAIEQQWRYGTHVLTVELRMDLQFAPPNVTAVWFRCLEWTVSWGIQGVSMRNSPPLP